LGNAEKKEEEQFSVIKEKVLEEVKDFLAPELINRLSAQIVFKPLSKDLMGQILRKELDLFLGQWKAKVGLKLPKF
jgi:ATP-dependent Clp protease ATP-binding subunit ClpA